MKNNTKLLEKKITNILYKITENEGNKILITAKVSFEKQVFHEEINQWKSATWFRFCLHKLWLVLVWLGTLRGSHALRGWF